MPRFRHSHTHHVHVALVYYGYLKTAQAEAGNRMQTISSRAARLWVQLRAANSRHISEKMNVGGGFICFDVSLLNAQCPSSFHEGSKRGKKRKAGRQEKPRAAAPIPEPALALTCRSLDKIS